MKAESSHRYWYDVFVSYPRDLARWVKGMFLPTFRDVYHGPIFADESIEAGEQWRSELRQAHLHSKILVPILCPAFLNSPWCKAEIKAMLVRQKMLNGERLIVPVLHSSVALPREIDDIQREDFRQWSRNYDKVQLHPDLLNSFKSFARMIGNLCTGAPNWSPNFPELPLELPQELHSTAEMVPIDSKLGKFLRSRKYRPRSKPLDTQITIEDLRPQRGISALAFSSPCTAIVGQAKGALISWDIGTGAQLCKPDAHRLAITDIAVASGQGNLITSSVDKTLKIWASPADLRPIQVLEGHTSTVRRVAVTPDGATAISASADGTLRLWDVQNGLPRGKAIRADDQPHSVAVHPSGKYFLCGTRAGRIRQVSLDGVNASGFALEHADPPGGVNPIFALDISADGMRALSGAADRRVVLWDLLDGQIIKVFEGHRETVRTVRFAEDGSSVVSGAADMTIRLWDIDSGEELAALYPGHSSWVNFVVPVENKNHILSGSFDGVVRVWDLNRAFGGPNEGRSHLKRIRGLAAAEEVLLSASFDGKVKVWGVTAGTEILELYDSPADHGDPFSRDQAIDVDVTSDAQYAVSGHSDGGVRLWNLAPSLAEERPELEMVLWPDGNPRDVFGVAISDDARIIASASEDCKVRVWERTDSGWRAAAALAGHKEGVNSVVISPDQEILVTGADDRQVRVWNWRSGTSHVLRSGQEHSSHFDEVLDVAISPDGATILSTGKDTLIHVWNLLQKRHIATLSGHTGWVLAVAFHPSGRWAVSASVDRQVKLWDLQAFREISHYEVKTPLYSCTIADDGNCIVAGDSAGYLHYWDVGPLLEKLG